MVKLGRDKRNVPASSPRLPSYRIPPQSCCGRGWLDKLHHGKLKVVSERDSPAPSGMKKGQDALPLFGAWRSKNSFVRSLMQTCQGELQGVAKWSCHSKEPAAAPEFAELPISVHSHHLTSRS